MQGSGAEWEVRAGGAGEGPTGRGPIGGDWNPGVGDPCVRAARDEWLEKQQGERVHQRRSGGAQPGVLGPKWVGGAHGGNSLCEASEPRRVRGTGVRQRTRW